MIMTARSRRTRSARATDQPATRALDAGPCAGRRRPVAPPASYSASEAWHPGDEEDGTQPDRSDDPAAEAWIRFGLPRGPRRLRRAHDFSPRLNASVRAISEAGVDGFAF